MSRLPTLWALGIQGNVVCLQAPVAFGLATYLLSAKWAAQRARQALLVFAAASPVVAALTYLAIMVVPGLSSQVWCCHLTPLRRATAACTTASAILEA